jgi:hypothetical protein
MILGRQLLATSPNVATGGGCRARPIGRASVIQFDWGDAQMGVIGLQGIKLLLHSAIR